MPSPRSRRIVGVARVPPRPRLRRAGPVSPPAKTVPRCDSSDAGTDSGCRRAQSLCRGARARRRGRGVQRARRPHPIRGADRRGHRAARAAGRAGLGNGAGAGPRVRNDVRRLRAPRRAGPRRRRRRGGARNHRERPRPRPVAELHERRGRGSKGRGAIQAGRRRPRGADRACRRRPPPRGDYQSFLDGLHDRSERRAAAVRPVDAAALTETVRRLPSAMTAIEYVVRERRLHIFVARKNHITHVSVAISRARLAARVEHLTSMISAGDLRYRAAARELFATLIAPVERQIGGAKVLCIVPDETLWRVPFAALVDERERFLVERFAVSYAPSLPAYREIASRSASLGGTPRVLAVAGSVRGAEREGHALCSIYGRHRCQLLARTAATEGRIKSELAQGTLVHFATHGVFDDRNPMNSRLLLRRGDDAEEDGSLEAWEIARLRLRADLVVLSGCDTARGRIGGGEGVIGMVWSFFVAGARSAVATQWAVETTSAADLMMDFERVLHSGGAPLAKARALRAAQLRILRREGTRHPFYWAGFVLFGDAS